LIAIFCALMIVVGIAGGEAFRLLRIPAAVVLIPSTPLLLIVYPLIRLNLLVWEGRSSLGDLTGWFVAGFIYWYILSGFVYLVVDKFRSKFKILI